MVVERQRLTRAVRVAAVLALAVVCGCGRIGARRNLQKGNEAYGSRDFEEAIGYYSKVPPGIPERVEAALNSAYSHQADYHFGSRHPKDREHAAEAVKAFVEFLEIKPKQTKATHYPSDDQVDQWIFDLLLDSERYQDAEDRLNHQLKQSPDDAKVLRGFFSLYDKWGGKQAQALDAFQRWAKAMAKTTPKDPNPNAAVAAYCWNVSFRQGSTLLPIERNKWIWNGLQSAEAAMAIDPEFPDGLTYKGLLLRERAKLRVDPDTVAVLLRDAVALATKSNEIRKAKEEAAAKAKAAAPATPSTHAPDKT